MSPSQHKLIVATRNLHKLEEIRAILSDSDLELLCLDSLPDLPEVDEDGATFDANAIKKARTIALMTHAWTLADDSGLEVDALGGKPGVYSARYAGEPVDYEANNRKLLRALAGVEDRRARFRCVVGLSSPRGECRTVEGRCEGTIVGEPRGQGGFGYDPVFVPRGYAETFAEMAVAEKNRISHRAMALRAARHAWFDGSFSF